tara:strand:+ start:198 stop:437 length:240 start_codon:yes stop_codon:yes gene_type:complete
LYQKKKRKRKGKGNIVPVVRETEELLQLRFDLQYHHSKERALQLHASVCLRKTLERRKKKGKEKGRRRKRIEKEEEGED